MKILPLKTQFADYEMEFSISQNASVRVRFRWDDRAESWFADLMDSDGNILCAGCRVCAQYPLFAEYTVEGLPSGWFLVLDKRGTGADVGRYDLGNGVDVVYMTADEVNEMILLAEYPVVTVEHA